MLNLTEPDVRAMREATGLAGSMVEALHERARRWTATPGVVTPGAAMEWWHVAWERVSDVAATYRLAPSDASAAWLREQTLRIARLPEDDWVGPFFRHRESPAVGTLETAHVTLALSTAASLTPDLFSDSEHEEIRAALSARGQTLCGRFLNRLDRLHHPRDTRHHINNWAMVLLNGFGTASVVLGDDEAIDETVERFGVLASLFEDDSYGESLQYWNYAAAQLSHLRDVLVEHDPGLHDRLDISGYTRCLGWAVHSHVQMSPLSRWGDVARPRVMNFGDCAVMFRPTAEVLLHISTRAAATHPVTAGLARWLFETTYAVPDPGPDEGDSFGFANTFGWRAITMLPDATPSLTPDEAGLPLATSFAEGTAVVRDRWENPRTVLGIHGGHDPLRVVSHRHADQNSFAITHDGERLLVDPGHCCYRLDTQQISASGRSHSTWSFIGPDGPIEQRKATHLDPATSRRPTVTTADGSVVISSDVAAAYSAPVRRAERTWVAALPHAVVVIDRIEADEPITVETHTVLNNRDGRLVVDERELLRRGDGPTSTTITRGSAGMRLVRLVSVGDGSALEQTVHRRWGYVHDLYHPQPNQPAQGREGSASIYTSRTAAPVRSYYAVYAIALDDAARIAEWSIAGAAEDDVVISRQGGAWVHVRIDGDGIVTSVDTHR